MEQLIKHLLNKKNINLQKCNVYISLPAINSLKSSLHPQVYAYLVTYLYTYIFDDN